MTLTGLTPPAGTPPAAAEAPKSAVSGTIASGTDAPPAEGAKPEETPPPSEPAAEPVTVADLKLPEGVDNADPALKEFLDDANASKMPKEMAQKQLDKYYAGVKAAAEAPIKVYQEMNTKWTAEVKADPEIGGANFESVTRPMLDKYIKTFGGDPAQQQALRDALDLTGAGNNPAILRAMVRSAKATEESTAPVVGQPPAAPARPGPAQALYPNLVQKA